MAMVQIQVWKSLNGWKVPAGPMMPMPGPVLLIEAITALKAVLSYTPEITSAKLRVTTLIVYRWIKPNTDSTVRSEIT